MVSWWTWILNFKWIFILARNYIGFVVDMYFLYVPHIRLRACIQRFVFVMLLGYLQNRLRSRSRLQNVRSHVVRETVRSESNRPRVLRDQKVLPEVRNRPLLLREFSTFQSSKNWYESNRGPFRFTYSISDIPITPSWSLRSFRNWRLVCWQLHVDTDFEI